VPLQAKVRNHQLPRRAGTVGSYQSLGELQPTAFLLNLGRRHPPQDEASILGRSFDALVRRVTIQTLERFSDRHLLGVFRFPDEVSRGPPLRLPVDQPAPESPFESLAEIEQMYQAFLGDSVIVSDPGRPDGQVSCRQAAGSAEEPFESVFT